MTRAGVRQCLMCATIVALSGTVAAAQSAPAFRRLQITVAAGASLANGYPVGDVTATLRRNTTGTATPFTLLSAESRVERASGFEARLGLALSRAFAVELGGSYSQPQLGVTVSADPEASAGAFASERIHQYIVDVSGVYQLPVTLGRRARVYAIGGGGYLRQLHDGRLLVDTGKTIHAGAGLQYWIRRAQTGRSLGARAEGRLVRRLGGVEFEERARSFPAISILGFIGF